MLSHLKGKVTLAVMSAAKRGNPLAKHLVTRETKRFAGSLPEQSPIISGDFMIPDLSRPLPKNAQGGFWGDFELVPLDRVPVQSADLVGRKVAALMTSLGSFGVGSHGFVGLLFEDEAWLIIPIYHAATWLELDGRIVENADAPEDTSVWVRNGDDTELTRRVAGGCITGANLGPHSLRLECDTGAVLEISENPEHRPKRMDGTSRRFLADDSLAKSVLLSPSGELSVF